MGFLSGVKSVVSAAAEALYNISEKEKPDSNQAFESHKAAAIDFRRQKKYVEAAEALEAAALVSIKELGFSDPAPEKLLDDAYNLFYEPRPLDALRCRQLRVDRCLDKGDYTSGALMQETIATLYENKLHDLDNAVAAYQLAAQWLMTERRIATADKLYKKIGEICAQKGDYYLAIEAFETYFENSLRSSAARYQCVPAMFSAGVCHIGTQDLVGFSRALQHYVNMDDSVGDSPQCKYLFELRQAWEDGDEQAYKASLEHHKNTSAIEGWQKKIILNGLESIKGGVEDFS